jgi:hypothetical protein
VGKRVAIIGAGAGGLGAAVRLRDRGYDDITVFEGTQRIGGKAYSVEVDGRYYDMGAVVISKIRYPHTWDLANRYQVDTFPRDEPAFAVNLESSKWAGLEPMVLGLHSSGEYFSSVVRAIRYIRRYRKFFDVPGFSFNHCPELEWLRTELAVPFDQWAKERRLTPLATMWEPSTVDMGYGPYRDVAALYMLHYMLCIPRTTVYSALTRRLRKGGLGFRSFTRGAQSLFEAVARDHRVYTGVQVTRIARQNSSWQLFSESEKALGSFDAILLAIPLDRALELLDPADHETWPDGTLTSVQQEVARELRGTDYYATLAEADGLPDEATAYFSFKSQSLGLLGGHSASRPWIDSPLWVFYHYGVAQQPGNSDAAVEALRADLAKVDVKLKSVVLTKGWSNYFPRVSQSAIAGGFYDRIDALQGRNGVYYLGGSLGFEVLEQTIAYSYWLVDQHFPLGSAATQTSLVNSS